MVWRIFSPPGTSPTPVLPALSRRMIRLRVKKGPCAPLRFMSMLSWPATGTTRSSVTTGVLVVEGMEEVVMVVWKRRWGGLKRPVTRLNRQ
ncbi:hypothetical protein D3C71_1068940 [compost metagenome]